MLPAQCTGGEDSAFSSGVTPASEQGPAPSGLMDAQAMLTFKTLNLKQTSTSGSMFALERV